MRDSIFLGGGAIRVQQQSGTHKKLRQPNFDLNVGKVPHCVAQTGLFPVYLRVAGKV